MKPNLFSEGRGLIPHSEDAEEAARDFALNGWNARRFERGLPAAKDLSNACKFASLFARELFGGTLKGNAEHQYLELPSGQVVDLTQGSAMFDEMDDPMVHDPDFWGNPEHVESLESCMPRVDDWVKGFLAPSAYIDGFFEEPKRQVDLEVLLEAVYDPFNGGAWDIPAFTEEDVQDFIDRGKMSAQSWQAMDPRMSGERLTGNQLVAYHLSRIAYLAVYPDQTPVRLEEDDGEYLRIEDGYHRVAAAVMRGDSKIMIQVSNADLDLACEIFELDNDYEYDV